jgi:tetratricopeptide (TPR) repeat protein
MSMKFCSLILLLFLLFQSCKGQTDKQKLSSLCDLGLQADSVKDFKKSIGYYDQMLAIDSIDMAGLINRGRALITIGKINDGFRDLNKAIKYWPNARTYFARGLAYLYLKQSLDLGKKDLDAAIRLNYDPKFTDVYYTLSFFYIDKREYFQALYYLEIADTRNLHKGVSDVLKSTLGKMIGVDIVDNYNYNKIIGKIEKLPVYKNLEDSLLKETYNGLTLNADYDSTYKCYIIKVGDSDNDIISNKCRFVFKMDAATLSVLNPNGKLQ